jgi:cytochrome c-type biogenesis protein CcmF
MLKVWIVVLVLLTYSLSIFGTFTTRSGIMSSVHAFASSSIGGWFVAYISVMVIGTVYLLATRAGDLRSENRFESILSREATFLLNNLLFILLALFIFLGTMWPVLSEALKGEKEMVGPPYFNTFAVPIGLAILFLMGVGPVIPWRKSSPRGLWRSFALPLAVGALTAGVLVALGMRQAAAIASFAICAFVLATIVSEFWRGARARARSIGSGFAAGLADLARRNKRRYGGYAVHFAMLALFVGFTGKAFETETKVPVKAGDTVSIRGYDLKVEQLVEDDRSDPNFAANRMTVVLSRGDRRLATLVPETRFYHASEQLTTEVARWGSLYEDVYTVFVRTGSDGPAELQVFVNPLVRFVWLGGILLFLSTAFCMVPNLRPKAPQPGWAAADAVRAAEPARV